MKKKTMNYTKYLIPLLFFSGLALLPAALPAASPEGYQPDTPVSPPKTTKTRALPVKDSDTPPAPQAGQIDQEKPSPPLEEIDQIMEEFVANITSSEDRAILAVFDDLFRLTYFSAPELRIARENLSQKGKEGYTAWAKRFAPAISGTLSGVSEINPDESASLTEQDDDTHGDWGLSMDLPVYRRSLSVRLDLAETEERLAENNLQIKTQELDLKLRELLASYLESSYRLFNIRNSVRISQEHVDRIHRGYELRDQTRLELLRAEANLKELESRRDLDEQNLAAAQRALFDYTGLPASHPVFEQLNQLLADETRIAGCINSLAALDSSYPLIEPYIVGMNDKQLRSQFEKESLLYRKIKLEHELAGNKAKTYTAEEYPDLAVKGSLARKEDTRFDNYEEEGRVALVLSVPLFTGGTLNSNRGTREAAEQIAGITQTQSIRQTVHSIENTRDLITSLRKVYATQQVNLRRQQEIVTLSVKSYGIKQTSMEDLLTSKNRLIDAKNALMNTTNRLGLLMRQFVWQLGAPLATTSLQPKK